MRIAQAPRDVDVPASGAAVLNRRADETFKMGIGLQRLEVIAVRYVDFGNWPVAREIDQLAIGIDHRHRIDLRQTGDFLLQQDMSLLVRNQSPVGSAVADALADEIIADARQ